jgi:hypothetical protein
MENRTMQLPWLLILVTALYAGQVVQSLWQGQHATALIVAGYVVANVGLIFSTIR